MTPSGIDWPPIIEELQTLGTQERADFERGYLHSSLTHLGVRVPAVRKVARRLAKAPSPLDRARLESMTREAWATEIYELRSLAGFVLERRRAAFDGTSMAFFEETLRVCGTWALLDNLAIHVVGDVVRRTPDAKLALDRWARDDDFWLQRAALLALLGEYRSGGTFDEARFEALAAPLLDEREFFVRKAIGWVLRDLSRKAPAFPAAFLLRHRERVSGLTLREGAKYLSEADRVALGLR